MRFDILDLATGLDREEMSDFRDPAIKLFGRTIPSPENQDPSEPGEDSDQIPAPDLADDEKEICRGITNTEVKDPMPDVPEELDQGEPGISSSLNNGNEDEYQTSTQDDKATTDPKSKQDQSEVDALGQEKILKKPDKILPCPRCNSMDTKFCYYNNYNVNQPRHFCKNCQRYWTAGGTMRNVPVGAGRRKNKNYRHIMTSDGMPCTRVESPDSAHCQVLSAGLSASLKPLKGNGTILKFGPEVPLSESMASVLNLGDQKRDAEMGAVAGGENGEEPSCASSVTASNFVENDLSEIPVHVEQNGANGCGGGLTPVHHLQCFPGPPWPYPWSPGWNNVASMAASHCSSELGCIPGNGNSNPVPWNAPPMLVPPAFCAATFPFPFMPASFWGCMSSWPNGVWNMPWLGSNGILSLSSSKSNSMGSGNGSPTLGKHSRDASLHGEEKTEKSLWVPKTLRIDDPDEAAKSSIWATLGIKPEESIKRGGIFKAFRSKSDSNGHTSDATQILHANPAALSRSQTFQEST